MLWCSALSAAPPDEAGGLSVDVSAYSEADEELAAAEQDAQTWRILQVKEFPDLNLQFTRLQFSHDGTMLCAAGEYGECYVWDTATWKEVLHLKHHTIIWDAAFSPDDKQLLTCGEDSTLVLWDVKTGKQIQEFGGHKNAVRSCAISPDGRRVAGGGGRPFVPAGRQPASVDYSVRVWEVDSGQEVVQLEGHAETVSGVAFLAARDQLVSTGENDGMMIVWDVDKSERLRTIPGFESDSLVEKVSSILLPDRQKLLTFGQAMFGGGIIRLNVDEKPDVRLWDVESGREIRDYGINTEGEGYADVGPLPGSFVTVDMDFVPKDYGPDVEQLRAKAHGQALTIGTVRVRDVETGELMAAYIRGGPRWDGSTLTGPIAASATNQLVACAQSAYGLVVLKLVENEPE